jgi:hypothetical protein
MAAGRQGEAKRRRHVHHQVAGVLGTTGNYMLQAEQRRLCMVAWVDRLCLLRGLPGFTWMQIRSTAQVLDHHGPVRVWQLRARVRAPGWHPVLCTLGPAVGQQGAVRHLVGHSVLEERGACLRNQHSSLNSGHKGRSCKPRALAGVGPDKRNAKGMANSPNPALRRWVVLAGSSFVLTAISASTSSPALDGSWWLGGKFRAHI